MKYAAMMLFLALLVGCSSSAGPPRGHYSAVVTDYYTDEPLPGAMVVGVFGYEAFGLHESSFICTGIDVRATEAAGHVAFPRDELPAEVFVYKQGYWVTGWGGADMQYLIGKLSERAPPSFRTARNDSPEARRGRQELGRAIKFACQTWKSEWPALKPLRAALARETIQSATDDEQRSIAVDLCRDLAAEGDEGGRVPGMGNRFVFTGLEATRLRSSVPECLNRELLLLKMRRSLEGVPTANAISPEELLGRAIVDDPTAYVQRVRAQRSVSTSCKGSITPLIIQLPGHDTAQPPPVQKQEPLDCCVSTGAPQRFGKLVDKVRAKGLQFEVHDNSVCVRRNDVPAVQGLASEVISDL